MLETMNADLTAFVRSCLQCEQCEGRSLRPRPLSTQVRGQKPNEVIAFDYMYMIKRKASCKHPYTYLLVIKDTFSHFVMLEPCDSPNTTNVVKALLKW